MPILLVCCAMPAIAIRPVPWRINISDFVLLFIAISIPFPRHMTPTNSARAAVLLTSLWFGMVFRRSLHPAQFVAFGSRLNFIFIFSGSFWIFVFLIYLLFFLSSLFLDCRYFVQVCLCPSAFFCPLCF